MKKYSNHIAIIGSGISGLVLGNTLIRNNIPCIIFEKYPSTSEYGAGISISRNGQNVLDELKVLDKLKSKSGTPNKAFFFSNCVEITSFDVDHITTSRKELHNVLLNQYLALGGEILFIESSLSKGKGNLGITGNLGKVMKESSTIALEYLKSNSKNLGIDKFAFDKYNIHIHVPEGSTPKDGPSAGITMLTSLMSLFTQKRVKKNLAMTGEITLRGKVLPVGGIKEKILAAKRSKIKEIILCDQNKKDIDEINPRYLKGLKFFYVKDMSEVLSIAITNKNVANPKKLLKID